MSTGIPQDYLSCYGNSKLQTPNIRNAPYPARVRFEHSESAWATSKAIDFLDEQDGNQPWCLHLSFIKPHWPLIAPAPYHDMFSKDDIPPAVRDCAEKIDPHPVYQAFMEQEYSKS